MARRCSISPPRHSVLQHSPCWGKRPQGPLPSEVLWFTLAAWIFLGRCSPLATTFRAEVHQHLSYIRTRRGCRSLLRGLPQPPSPSLFGVTWTHQAFGSPQSYSAMQDQATIQTYQRKWDTWKGMILPQTISSILNSLAKYMCVYIQISIYILHIFEKIKNNKVINTVIACVYLAQS